MKETKVLYISPYIKVANGGASVMKRNHRLLCQIVGRENFVPMEIMRKSSNPLKMFWDDITEKSFYGLDFMEKKRILQCIKEEHISIVFLDSSKLGGLAMLIHKHFADVRVITFFHNVEADFERTVLKLSKKWYFAYRIGLTDYNERLAIRSSDIIICLNERDSSRLKEKYGRKADEIIPVTLDSTINEESLNQHDISNDIPHLLFFGSNFPPNIEGIKLFVEKVMPKVNGVLTIAGVGMDQLKSCFLNKPRVEVRGFVENVDDLYGSADIVVLPIFSGAGMKVKTAEALKYGKYIIASDEALEGYKIDSLKGIIRCSNIEDFVTAIDSYTPQNRIQLENRKCFLDYYSDESAKKALNSVLKGIDSHI